MSDDVERALDSLAGSVAGDKELGAALGVEDFTPEVEQVQREPSLQSKAMAGIIVSFAASAAAFFEPLAVVTPEEKEAAADIVAKMLEAGGGELPEWLVPYQPYIEGIIGLGFIGYSVVIRVKEEKAKVIDQEADKGQAA